MRASRLEQHPLTYVRHRLGWSMERLARELHLAAARHGMILNPDRDRVYKWESGRVHAPDGDYQMLLAELLGVEQELVQSMGWPWWLPAYDTPYGFEPDGTRAVLREVLVALQHPERPDRRAFLAVGAAALAGVGQQWAAVEPGRLLGALHGRRVDGTLLAWLETPDSGSIVLNGTSLGALSSRDLIRKRNEFQLLLQDPYNALPPRTTVGRMIEESVLIRGRIKRADLRKRVIAAMAEVSLSAELYDQLPNALSTGERQRISIARALILDPKLLILDETLSALDQREQGRLIELFSKLQEKNDLTYVFISHDLAMVRKVCTRIAVMYLGEMVEIADNHDLFFDPQHPYTKALLSAAPTLEQKPFDPSDFLLEGEPPSPIDIPAGCSFASRCPKAFGRCRVETPALVEHSPGRFAACHLLDSDRAQAAA